MGCPLCRTYGNSYRRVTSRESKEAIARILVAHVNEAHPVERSAESAPEEQEDSRA